MLKSGIVMNFLIYLSIPLVVTGIPFPGTYGDVPDGDPGASYPEVAGTQMYSKYALEAAPHHHRGSPLDDFAVDQQGEYYRKGPGKHIASVGKPNIYYTPTGGSEQQFGLVASDIYSRLKDKATKLNKSPLNTALSPASSSPSLDYGVPEAQYYNPALLKLADGLLAARHHHKAKHPVAVVPQAAPYASLIPIAAQPHLVPLQDPAAGHLLQSQVIPIYQNGLVPLYQTPVAPALYQPTVLATPQTEVIPLAHQVPQPVVATDPAPIIAGPLVKAVGNYHAPGYKTGVAPLIHTAPGVEATIVPAIEEHVPEVPLLTRAPVPVVPLHQPAYTRFLASDAIVHAKGPKVLLHKAVLKGSPVLAGKGALKVALAPVVKSPGLHHHHHAHHLKAIVRAPQIAHYTDHAYLAPDLPAKLLHSEKPVLKALIGEDTGKAHYGKGVIGLPPGTKMELVPSLSYGFSYSLYPKANGLYGPPGPLGGKHYAKHHEYDHHQKAHPHDDHDHGHHPHGPPAHGHHHDHHLHAAPHDHHHGHHLHAPPAHEHHHHPHPHSHGPHHHRHPPPHHDGLHGHLHRLPPPHGHHPHSHLYGHGPHSHHH